MSLEKFIQYFKKEPWVSFSIVAMCTITSNDIAHTTLLINSFALTLGLQNTADKMQLSFLWHALCVLCLLPPSFLSMCLSGWLRVTIACLFAGRTGWMRLWREGKRQGLPEGHSILAERRQAGTFWLRGGENTQDAVLHCSLSQARPGRVCTSHPEVRHCTPSTPIH